jgi:hypothetical protein
MPHVRAVVLVFDKAPIVLSATEYATHWHVASLEYDEITRLCAELGFQVAARLRARKL